MPAEWNFSCNRRRTDSRRANRNGFEPCDAPYAECIAGYRVPDDTAQCRHWQPAFAGVAGHTAFFPDASIP